MLAVYSLDYLNLERDWAAPKNEGVKAPGGEQDNRSDSRGLESHEGLEISGTRTSNDQRKRIVLNTNGLRQAAQQLSVHLHLNLRITFRLNHSAVQDYHIRQGQVPP